MPAKREDDGNPVILFLCDTSGSCDEISEQSTKVAQSASILGVRGADVWVVFHDDLTATTQDAMHNGKHVQDDLERRIDRLKEHGNLTQDILRAIRPQLVINITDMDSIKMNMDVLALGKWKTLVLDTYDWRERWGGVRITPERGRFYTTNALIRDRHVVGYSSYYDESPLMENHILGIGVSDYIRKRYHTDTFPNEKTLQQAITMSNRYLLWSFHNTDVASICASINDYASPDRLTRLTVR